MTKTMTAQEIEKSFLGSLTELKDWFDARPEHVREAIKKYPPSILYKLRNQFVFLYCYDEEDGKCETCSVKKSAEFNADLHWWECVEIFDVKLADLVHVCDREDADVFRVVPIKENSQ